MKPLLQSIAIKMEDKRLEDTFVGRKTGSDDDAGKMQRNGTHDDALKDCSIFSESYIASPAVLP